MKLIEHMMVSVCCTTYNLEEYVKAALDGIMMQQTTYPFEVIVHDDASTDKTPEIIREYEKCYPGIIKPIFQTENQLSKAGIYPYAFLYAAAKGKYIADCDGDDYWTDPLKLQKQVDFMEANPGCSLCYHEYKMLRDGVFSEPSTSSPRDYTADELIAFPIEGYGIATSTKLWRNKLTPLEMSYLESRCPDYCLNVIMGMYGSCKFIPGIKPSVYRKHKGNTWSGTPRIAERTQAMFQRLHEQLFEAGNQHALELRKVFL
jgi:glycosyltransferase involved in cell wall biosynthesis